MNHDELVTQLVRVLDEELGDLFPLNPSGSVTELFSDAVLTLLAERLARFIELRGQE